MADNVTIDIRALVRGLQDVRNLVREIERLPAAGAGVGGLNAQLRTVTTELRSAVTEARTLGRETQAAMNGASTATARVPSAVRSVRSELRGTGTDAQQVLRHVSSLGRALEQAFSGNILGALRSVGTAMRTSFDVGGGKGAGAAAAQITQIGTASKDAEKFVTRFSSVLGSAAKNAEGALSRTLLNDFGISAERALLNPSLAAQKFVSELARIPDAEERAIAVSNVFGASTAALLPTIEAMVAAEQRAIVLADELTVAEAATATAEARLSFEQSELAVAQSGLNVARNSSLTTATQLTAAETAVADATAAVAVAEAEAAAAAEALATAQQACAAAAAEMATAEVTAEVASGGLLATLGTVALTIGGVLAVAGLLIAIFAALGNSAGKAGEKVYELSVKTGLSFAAVQTLGLIAKETGKNVESTITGFDRYLKNVNEAAGGNKNLAFTMRQLGIDTKAASKDSDNALQQLFQAISKLPPGAQQVDAAMKLAGKSGADLIPIIEHANGSFEDFKKHAQELGVILSDDNVKAAHEYEVSMRDLGESLTGVKNRIGAELLPTLVELANNLLQFIKDNQQGFSDLGTVISVSFKIALAVMYAFGGTVAFLTNLIYGLVTAILALMVAVGNLEQETILAGIAVAQYLAGDIAGAIKTMDAAINHAKNSVHELADEVKRAGTIIAQPTFTSLLHLFDDPNKPTTPPPPKPTRTFAGGSAPKKGHDTGDQLAKAQEELEKARLQAQESLLRDSLKRQEDELKQHFAVNKIGYQQYYDQLEGLQLADLDVQIKYQQALLAIQQKQLDATKKEPERLRIQAQMVATNEKITVLERQRGDVSRNASFESERAAREYLKTLHDIESQLREFSDRTADAAALRIDEQFRDALEKARAHATETGDTSDVQKIERLKELLKLQARFNELSEQVQRIEDARGILQDELADKVARGTLSQVDANKQLAEFEEKQRSTLADLLPGMQKVADAIGKPELQAAVAKIRNDLEHWHVEGTKRDVDELRRQADELGEAYEQQGRNIDLALKSGQINEQQAHDSRMANAQAYATALLPILDELQAIAVATHDTALQDYIDKARTGLSDLTTESDHLGQQLNQGFLGSIGGLLGDLRDGTKTAKAAFLDFGASVLKVLTDVLIKIILTKIALAAFGGGGGGGFGGFLSGLLGGDKAAGNTGVASGGGFASGGLFRGIGTGTSDSNTINVSDGEFVVNAAATARHLAALETINGDINPARNFAAGGGVSPASNMAAAARMPDFKIVNVLPNDLLADYLTSGDGGQAILNFIENNAGAVNSRLRQAG